MLMAHADLLLQHEPGNMQAQSLRVLIERGVTKDGYIGESRLGGVPNLKLIFPSRPWDISWGGGGCGSSDCQCSQAVKEVATSGVS